MDWFSLALGIVYGDRFSDPDAYDRRRWQDEQTEMIREEERRKQEEKEDEE